MRRTHFKLVVDVVLLVAAFLTFASGLVLFLDLHRDMGALRTSALGLSRLAWLNLHRLPALLVVTAIVLHLAFNWAAFVARLRNSFARKSKSRGIPELALYVTFWTVALTGIVAWFFVSGSAPLAGPVPLGWLYHTRHHLIEVHHSVGFVALTLAVHHVGHRWHRMVRCLGSWVHCDHAANPS
jgi:heme/copper-type cytochrome/quinol oxidase subunit 2